MRFQQLAGGHGLVVVLLALPVLQQGFEHVQAVVHSAGAQQGCCCGTGDEGRRLGEIGREAERPVKTAGDRGRKPTSDRLRVGHWGRELIF